MGTITTGTGLISGLDTKSIIDQLIALEGRQKDLVQAKVDNATAQKTAYLQLSTRLTGLQITSQQIAKPSFFQNAATTSSNEDVMTATAAPGRLSGRTSSASPALCRRSRWSATASATRPRRSSGRGS